MTRVPNLFGSYLYRGLLSVPLRKHQDRYHWAQYTPTMVVIIDMPSWVLSHYYVTSFTYPNVVAANLYAYLALGRNYSSVSCVCRIDLRILLSSPSTVSAPNCSGPVFKPRSSTYLPQTSYHRKASLTRSLTRLVHTIPSYVSIPSSKRRIKTFTTESLHYFFWKSQNV